MNCPWDWLRQSPLLFCEQSLCGWIKQPANTWSNIGFLLVGLLIFRRAGKLRQRALKTIGVASIVTGLGSAFYHASGTQWGGLFDYGGMFLGTGVLTGLNMRRWRGWGEGATYATMLLVSGLLIAAVLVFPTEERLIYALSGPCCIIELVLFVTQRHEINYKFYILSWVIISVATLLWWLDMSGTLCNPENHILNGHAAWHLLTALVYYLVFLFYSQFRIFKNR